MQHAAKKLLTDMRKAAEVFPAEYSDCTEAVADMAALLQEYLAGEPLGPNGEGQAEPRFGGHASRLTSLRRERSACGVNGSTSGPTTCGARRWSKSSISSSGLSQQAEADGEALHEEIAKAYTAELDELNVPCKCNARVKDNPIVA